MDKMSVCYATSDEFTIHTGISLLSLLDNNKGVIGRTYVLDYGMTDESKSKLRGICDKYNVECIFIWAKDKLVEIGAKTGIKNFRDSFATYSRAFLDLLLPDDADKVLYIDSDTVIIGSVAPIMDIDMEGKAICGCYAGVHFGRAKDGKGKSEEVINLLTHNTTYVQCGILWYSLANWRRFNCRELIMNTTNVLTQYRYADQTLINNSLPDKYFEKMPLKYNLTQHTNCERSCLEIYRCGYFYSDEEILEAIRCPIVIHYCGGAISRPWFDICISRRKQHYLDYKKLSPWKDVPIVEAPRAAGIKGKIKHKLTAVAAKTNNYMLFRILSKFSQVLFR